MESLIGPAVVAAVIAGAFGLITLRANVKLAETVHRQRLKSEREALERRGEIERELADKRMQLDRRLAFERRRAEVAELILMDFYEAKRAFEVTRQPMVFAQEMVAEEGVDDEVIKNAGYGVIRRLRGFSELFARIEARRPLAAALLGPNLDDQFQEMVRIHNKIMFAADALLKYRNDQHIETMREFLPEQRRIAFDLGDDEDNGVSNRIKAMIAQVETACRPALEPM